MNFYRIVDWAHRFENAGSRKYRRLSWVPMPNTHDGAGFRRIMREPDGVEIYGAWCLIVQVASKCPERGTLINDHGEPITAEDLADKCGGNIAIFERCFALLTEPRIAWLESASSTLLAASSTLPASPSTPGDATNTRPDPTRSDPEEKRRDLPDPTTTAGAGFSQLVAPGRAGAGNGSASGLEKWRNLFVAEVCRGLGLDPARAVRQRRPLISILRRFENEPNRQDIAEALIALAEEKGRAGLDNPAAAWQAEVDRQLPKG